MKNQSEIMDQINERLEKIEKSIDELKEKIALIDKKVDLQEEKFRLKFAFYNVLIPIFLFIIGFLLGKVII